MQSADPKEYYDARGSYDGSVSLLPPEQGGPVIIYDAMPDPPPDGLGDDAGWMAVARAKNASDPYLIEWVKDPGNPIWFDDGGNSTGQPKNGPVFPSEIWENDGHFNFLAASTPAICCCLGILARS